MKPLVIYHDQCTDGFAAAFAAWLELGDEAEYLPMQYGQAKLHEVLPFNPLNRDVYILDFSFERPIMEFIFRDAKRVVWLDHHKTAFEMWGVAPPAQIWDDCKFLGKHHITLDNNKSGAMLAWEYFHPGTKVPLLIKHIDDRDRWQWKMDGSAELHAALDSMKPWSFVRWYGYHNDNNGLIEAAIEHGTAILRAQKQHVANMAKQVRKCKITKWQVLAQHEAKFEGLAVNATLHISEVGHELANTSGTYGLVYYIAADNRVKCSLRSDGDYDVSAIAKAFGGGGHKNAAGFETDINTLMKWLA